MAGVGRRLPEIRKRRRRLPGRVSTTLPSTTGGSVTLTARARGGCTGAISWASANRPEAATTQTASDTAQRRMCARDMNNSLGRMNLGGQRRPGISCWLPCGGERTGSTCDFIRPWCRASPWTAMKPSAVVARGREVKHWATSLDGSSISPCRRTKLRIFFEQAGSALCCEPRKVVRDMPVGPLVVRRPLTDRLLAWGDARLSVRLKWNPGLLPLIHTKEHIADHFFQQFH